MARKKGEDRGIVEKPKGSGKWWVRLFINGREKWERCDNKTQARTRYGKLKAEAREGRYFKKEKAFPFRQIALEYEEVLDANRRGRKGDDRSRIQRWINAFGDQDAKTIEPKQVQRVLLDFHREGLQPSTIERHLTVLMAILNRQDGLEVVAIVIRKKVKKPEYDNEILRWLTNDQENTLLPHLPERFHPITIAAINTGLRQGNLLNLLWSDINWTTGMITVRKSKSGKSRRIPMNSIVQNILLAQQNQVASQLGDRIFPHDARYLRRAFNRAVKQAGLSPFRFHDLRHTFASRLAMLGCNDRTIMELGGWDSPRMLKRYAHIAPAHLWKAVEGLTQDGTGSKTGSDQKDSGLNPTQLVEKIGAGKGI